MTLVGARSLGLLATALLAAAALVLVLGAGAPDAEGAKKKKANVRITVQVTDNGQPAPDHFFGKVKSPKKVCKREGRTVRLFFGNEPVATGKLKAGGEYLLGIDNPHPNFKPFTVRIKATKKCKAAKSEKVFAN